MVTGGRPAGFQASEVHVVATFRLRRYYRNLGLGGALGCFAWMPHWPCSWRRMPRGTTHRLVAAAAIAGVPLVS